jgi:exopolyphosphatase/pppGpp-phosphohydrolase
MIEIENYLSEYEIATLLNKYLNNRTHNHEENVSNISIEMFEIVSENYLLNHEDKQLLKASAYLHDIGYFINKTDHHKHSSYLILNDKLLDRIPDFRRSELALLCENHRKIEPCHLEGLPPGRKLTLLKLIAILRLADVLSSKQVKNMHFKNSNKNTILDLQLQDDFKATFLNKLALKSILSKQLFNLEINLL